MTRVTSSGSRVGRAGAVARVAGPLVLYATITILLFSGTATVGMQFDEVFRPNNLLPVLYPDAGPYDQSISSVTVLGKGVPLMYKEYISSASLLPYLPVALFADPVVGLRTLYLVYAIAVPSLGFLLFRDRAYWVAVVAPLLWTVSPLLYPEITFGFVDPYFLLALLPAARLFQSYVRRGGAWRVVVTGFLVGVAINVTFYATWVVVGLAVAGVVLYPRVLLDLVRRWVLLLATVAALLAGMVNYVYYNVTQGFPTVRPAFERIFRPDAYAENPIDFKESAGLVDEVVRHLRFVPELLGPAAAVIIVLVLGSLVVTAVGLVVAGRAHRLREVRLLGVPGIALVVAFGLILVSPNTTRRGHYAMLTGLLELCLVAAFVLLVRQLPALHRRTVASVAVVLVVGYTALGGATSRASVDRVIESGGSGFFSAAIFDLHDYLVAHDVDGSEVLQVQWGSAAQLYFLTKGELQSPSVMFQVMGAADDATRVDLVAAAVDGMGGRAYVPVYVDVAPPAGVDVDRLLHEVAVAEHGSLCLVEAFRGRGGTEDIRLYELVTAAGGAPTPGLRCDVAG